MNTVTALKTIFFRSIRLSNPTEWDIRFVYTIFNASNWWYLSPGSSTFIYPLVFSIYQITNEEYHNVETLILESYDHILDIKGHQRKKEAKMLPARELAYLSNLQEMVEMLDNYDATTVCETCLSYWNFCDFVLAPVKFMMSADIFEKKFDVKLFFSLAEKLYPNISGIICTIM